jgi:hypothetical protein
LIFNSKPKFTEKHRITNHTIYNGSIGNLMTHQIIKNM